jgi:hypothetical protein
MPIDNDNTNEIVVIIIYYLFICLYVCDVLTNVSNKLLDVKDVKMRMPIINGKRMYIVTVS